MATKLDPIIFGKDKSINYSKVSVGAISQAVSEDLVEFGQSGVQGVKLASNLSNFITYEKSAKRAADPYFQVGVMSNGSLVLLLLDKKDAKFEAMEMVVKGYQAIKDKLAASSAKVVNISHDKSEDIIKGASAAQADKFKTAVSNDDSPDFGGITGNVILCAHGRPKNVPSGRVIGDQFGRRTPEQIVALLTGDKDAGKRIGKDYSGIVTLSGCFTASGGPEGSQQDDPFAAKVLALLRKGGYNRLSVVGMPGPSITAREDGEKDSQGTAMNRGDKHVQTNATTADQRARLEKMEAAETVLRNAVNEQVKVLNAAVDERNKANTAYQAWVQQFTDLKKASTLKPADFLADPATVDLGKKVGKGKAEFEKLDTEQKAARKVYDDRLAAYEAKRKEIDDTGLRATMAKVTGSFGLRTLN